MVISINMKDLFFCCCKVISYLNRMSNLIKERHCTLPCDSHRDHLDKTFRRALEKPNILKQTARQKLHKIMCQMC